MVSVTASGARATLSVMASEAGTTATVSSAVAMEAGTAREDTAATKAGTEAMATGATKVGTVATEVGTEGTKGAAMEVTRVDMEGMKVGTVDTVAGATEAASRVSAALTKIASWAGTAGTTVADLVESVAALDITEPL